MFENLTDYIVSFVQGFKHQQFYLYLCVLGVAFLESLPILGVIMPGTFMLLLFGVLAAKGLSSLGMFILLATIGATIGDTIGYLIGRYGRSFFNEHNKLLKLSHIHTGEAFFARHGGKSVLFGRFIGPIRPIIALVAGAAHMIPSRFMGLNLSGAFIWTSLYIALGFFFTHNIRLIDKIVSNVSTAILAVFILIIGIGFYYKRRAKIMKD